MAALAAGTGITLDIFQITQIDFKWWTLVAFLVSCGFVISIIVGLNNKNRELENKKPQISVKPMLIDDMWCLEVANNGEMGTFTAEASVFGEDDNSIEPKYQLIGSKYNALWGKSNTDKSEILNGQSDIIRIAAIAYTDTVKYFEMKAYDTIKKCSYLVRHIEFDGFRDYTRQQNMQIIISADPSLKGGAFIREYSINLSGITESKPKKRFSIPDRYFFSDIEDDNDKILTELANLIPEGEDIRERCYNQNVEVPEQEAKDWAEKVSSCLDKLGSHYRSTFYNSDGLGTAKIPPMSSYDHQRVALFVSYRLMRIQQFLAELRQK